MGLSIHRIGNHEYLASRQEGRSLSISTRETLNAEIAALVSQKAAQKLQGLQKPKTVRFQFGGKKWKVVPINEYGLLQRLFRYLNIFSVKPVEGRNDRYRLEVAHLPMLHRQKNKEKRTLAGHAFIKQVSCSKQEYEQGARESVLGNGTLNPFTEISTKAFQKHESFLCLNDKSPLAHMDYRIVFVGDSLKLVHRDSALNQPEHRHKAAEEWKKLFIAQYGERKFHEMAAFYHLDFTAGLTAEHVYRGNIFASNVEMADLSDFAKRVVNGGKLSGQEQAVLATWKGCKKALQNVQGEIKALSPARLARLIQAFTPQNETYLTGRKIRYPIASNYSVGELKEYKPWLDQQELSQVFTQLIRCKSWEAYQELLSHVVVKKHLVRRYSANEMRLGVLIPAPPEKEGGPVRYYAVTQCISNGGILSYVLESPCGDPTLPTIKLYRSTTVDAYAVNFADTIVNDLNHLNSPGYLGIRDIDRYEKEFFDQRTIPLWVGYLEQAKRYLKLGRRDDAQAQLNKANQVLKRDLEKKIKKPSLLELMKAHDRPLNALFFPYNSSSHWEFLKNHRRDVLGDLINKYLHGKGQESDEEVKKDALALMNYLESVQPSIEQNDPLHHQIRELHQELDFWFVKEQKKKWEGIDEDMMKTISSKETKLEDWMLVLSNLARSAHEDIDSKTAVDLQMTGHSLGAACASVAMARYMALEGRMPLPGHSCSNFLFDSPGINREDNAAFLNYGKKHRALFKRSKVTFKIFHRHEAGDIVPVSGGMGIGATENAEESETLKKWCTFDAAVNRRKKQATHPEIAHSVAVHGTRFLEAQEGHDYHAKPVTPEELGMFNRGSNQLLKGKENREYKKLKASKWKLGSPLKRVFQEHVRQSFSLPLLFFRYSVASQRAQHVFPECQIDNFGGLSQVLK